VELEAREEVDGTREQGDNVECWFWVGGCEVEGGEEAGLGGGDVVVEGLVEVSEVVWEVGS
jgi:hypothetical protein